MMNSLERQFWKAI